MSNNTLGLPTNPFAPATGTDRAIAWQKTREFRILLVGAAIQILVLVAMIVRGATPLAFGDVVLLRVVPVDPRDLFRGDYVVLGYDFSRAPGGIDGLPGSIHRHDERQGRTVYVSLVPEPDGRHWRSGKISVSRPASGKYLRGTIDGWGRIQCGIESFYVQEGTGHKYEAAVRNGTLAAEVAVTSSGQATLKGLKIE
jgi:uncharacterized membrane-anchored protein